MKVAMCKLVKMSLVAIQATTASSCDVTTINGLMNSLVLACKWSIILFGKHNGKFLTYFLFILMLCLSTFSII